MPTKAARAFLLHWDGSREQIPVPKTFRDVLTVIDSFPPIIVTKLTYGVESALLVYADSPLDDHRPVNWPASMLHPKGAEVRGLAVILIDGEWRMEKTEVERAVDDVKRHFSDNIGAVRFGQKRIIITNRGKPAAALVSLEDLEILRKHKDGKKGEAA